MTRELMEKINDGILSDSELDEAIKFYRNLLDSLLYFGDEFNLFKNLFPFLRVLLTKSSESS